MDLPAKVSGRHFFGLVALIIAATALLIWSQPEPQTALRELAPTRVMVTEVRTTDVQPSVTITGQLRPARIAALRFQVSGQVEERLAEPGQPVEQGEVLLKLHSGDYVDAVTEAQARLAQEQAQVARDRRLLKLAERNVQLQQAEVNRLESLGSESLASRSQRDEAQQRLVQLQSEAARLRYDTDTAESRLALRRAELRRAERNLERTRLLAPFAGVVNSISVDVGDYVGPNDRVAEVVDSSHLDLHAEVSGETAAALNLGQEVTVVHAEGRTRQGRVIALQRDPSRVTHTYALRIRIADGDVLPGTLAEVRLPLRERRGVTVVPVSAILRDEGEAYVFRVREDQTLERVPVELGIREGQQVVVERGLAPGATIVAQDVAALTGGQKVQIASPQQPDAPAAG